MIGTRPGAIRFATTRSKSTQDKASLRNATECVESAPGTLLDLDSDPDRGLRREIRDKYFSTESTVDSVPDSAKH